MEKQIIGNKTKIEEELSLILDELDSDPTVKYQVSIKDTRTISQNDLLHGALRILAEEMGENNIEDLKLQLKTDMGLYSDKVIVENNKEIVIRTYKSTAHMSKRELSSFYDYICQQGAENFGLDIDSMIQELKQDKENNLSIPIKTSANFVKLKRN